MALKFKLMGVPIAIGIDFVVVMVVLGSFWRTPEQLPAWLAVATGSVLLHELGHAAIFDFFGVKPSIRLHGGGGVTMGLRLPPRQHVLVVLAGPAMGLIVGGIVGVTVLAAPRLGNNPIVEDLLWVNLGWSLINLLPFPGADGGQILSEVTTLVLGRPAELAGRIVGLFVIGAIFLGLVLIGLYDWALVLAVFAVFSTIRMGGLSDFMVGKRSDRSPGHLLVEGRYQEAFNAARLAMADKPGDLQWIMLASEALRLMSNYAEAEPGYNRILSHDPADAKALRGRAYVRRCLDREAEADQDLATLLALPSVEVAVLKAIALHDANRHADGYLLVQNALPLAENAATQQGLRTFTAIFEFVLGRLDEALRHADELVRDMPGRPDHHALRSLILCDMGRFDEARPGVARALGGEPKHPDFHESFGIVERLSGNAPAALQHLVDSAAVRPNHPEARAELALCYLQLGRMGEARAAFETLSRRGFRDPYVVYARAAAALSGGARDEAVELLREAGRLCPELALRAGVDPLFRALRTEPAPSASGR